jgi:tetratricopeptide (TPR) repeat protein
MNPQHLDAWNNKAVALAESGNSRESLLVLDQALAMAIPNPSVEVKHRMAKIYMNKGNILFTQGRVEEAITCYNNAIELHKDYASAWTSKGFALDNMGKQIGSSNFSSNGNLTKLLQKIHQKLFFNEYQGSPSVNGICIEEFNYSDANLYRPV